MFGKKAMKTEKMIKHIDDAGDLEYVIATENVSKDPKALANLFLMK